MRCFPSNLHNKIEKANDVIYPILLYGNEGGLISGLIKEVYEKIQKKSGDFSFVNIDHGNKNPENTVENIFDSPSLFTKKLFVVVKNPKENILIDLKKFNSKYGVLIINGEGIRSSSKIKTFFDSHKNYISVPCYQVDQIYIKKIIDSFITKNNISLNKEGYWFLIENINEDYLILKNELQKLSSFKNSSIGVKDLQKIIIQKNILENDNLFFNCASGKSNLVLKEINSSNASITDSYEVLISIKKFISILSSAVVNKHNSSPEQLVRSYLPRYLFLKKEVFKEILKKTTIKKISNINEMLQKTEYLLRKNSIQHKEILERFLLNLVKILK